MSVATAPARPRRSGAAPAAPLRRQPSRPDLYVVKPPARSIPTAAPTRAHRRVQIGYVVVALVFLVGFAIAVLQTVSVQGQMHLDQLQQQISEQQAQVQHLRLQAATLESPAHVTEAAQELGMVAPEGGPTFVPTVTDGDSPPPTGLPADATSVGQVAAAPATAPAP